MSLNLIIPIASDKPEYEKILPYVFGFAADGTSLCIKSIGGLNLNRFRNIYFTILDKHDKQFYLSILLRLQFKKLGLSNAHIVVLNEPTSSQPETVYRTIKKTHIEGGIFIKDPDGYFSCDFTEHNGITIYPLDELEIASPSNKSYVKLDDQFYITNIIEKKIIGRYFNAGGYLFEEASIFCSYYEQLTKYHPLYMSHIVYAMLLDRIPFRPIEVTDYKDWGTYKMYKLNTDK